MAKKRNKKLSYNSIQSKDEDWELDVRNGLKYSGESVQKWLKEQLDGKGGDFYYDATTTKYLVFADRTNRELYLENPEAHADLLIGTFDAPANYTAEIYMVTPATNTILKGATGNYIDFTFDIKSKSGASTGDAVVATFTINNGGNKKSITQIYNAGTSVHFLIDQYLSEGTNTVSVTISGRNTLAATTAASIFNVVDLELTSTLDFSQAVQKGEYLAVPYTLEGAGVKYLEWYVDGVKLAEVDSIPELKVSRTKNIDTAGIAAGKHNIQARAYITNNGENYYSETLYFDFYVRQSETATAVLLGVVLAAPAIGTGISLDAVQYADLNYKLAVYDSRNRALSVDLADNGTVVQSIQMQPGTVEALTYAPTTSGTHVLTFTADQATATISADVEESSIGISEATDSLLLKLSAKGRSNSETNPGTWTFTPDEQGAEPVTTSFTGFAWNEQSGWNNGALVIPAGAGIDINLAPLSGRPSQTGRTIEIDYETSNIEDDDAAVVNLVNSGTGAGLTITASTARLKSSGGAEVNTKYRGGDRVHLAFIINRTSGDNAKLMFIVNNGILERAASFAGTDSFNVTDNLHIGSNGCTVKVHSIRVYDKSLSVEESFGNYAIDSDNILEIANRNDILNDVSGAIDADKVNAKIPIMIITGDMQPIFDATDKSTTVYVDMEYRNLQDPTKNFTATHVRMRPQGTSSLGYPRKNLRPYTAAQYGCVMRDANGEVLEDGLYAFKDGSQPVNCWTLKADYAESSGSHNTGVARIWNDLMYRAQLNGEFVLRTEAQKAALQSGYDYDVRTTVDGFPIVVFWRINANSELVCLGQYNFNNDKSTEKVFGFKDIPGFDNSHVQCFEFKANENLICLFDDLTGFDEHWDDAFESRYPDTKSPDLTALKTLATWINSCKGNQQKWNDEKTAHFDLPKLAAYYVYLMRFGAVDQPVKNAMITTEDGEHWFFINYDNDTIIGIDNISTVLNAWNYDRQTQKPGGAYYYAGHNSALWNAFEADPECMALVADIDGALYSAGLTYANMNAMFDAEQCDKWCERIYNDNGKYKYIQPFLEKGSAVLYMLQGSRKSYRHWWLQHRFDLFDAKWGTGAFRNRVVRFIAEGAQGGTFSLRSATNTYYGYGINSIPQEMGVAVAKNATQSFTISQTLAIGDPVSIYNANNANKIDLSDFAEHLTTLYINQAVGNDGTSELKSLILGDGTAINQVFTEIGGLSVITSIEELDIRGFKKITNMNLAALRNLHTFNAANSGLTAFVPAVGATLTAVTLPDTIQSIALDGANVTTLTYTATHSLRSVTMRNVSGSFDVKTFVLGWIDLLTTAEQTQAELTLTGIRWTGCTAAQVLKLGKIGTRTLQGKVTLNSLTQEEYQQIVAVFGADVFSASGSFVIEAPSGMLIAGPTALTEGETGQFTATVFPASETPVKYLLYNGSTLISSQTDGQGRVYRTYNGVTLYEATGDVTVDQGISSAVTVKVRAQLGSESTYSDYIELTASPLTYPSSVNISGSDNVNETGNQVYTKAFNTNNFSARVLSVVWSLSTNTACTLASSNENSATVNVATVGADAVTATLTCTVTLTGNRTVVGTKEITIKEQTVVSGFVDLGLPSGLLWADRNIGANAPEEFGLYFQWGDTEGHAEGSGYNFSQDNYNAKGLNNISADLSLSQDAANVALGGSCRMPTRTEFQELYDNCNSAWVTENGVAGRRFTSKTNGNSIFFPAAGYYDGTTLYNRGSSGLCWSASRVSASLGYGLYFNSGNVYPQSDNSRRYGFSVRAVQ
jgi:hypothetical protein